MSLQLKVEYLNAIRIRYYNSSKKSKSIILDELCAVTGYSRKAAIRAIARGHFDGKKSSGRKSVYSKVSVIHLKRLWTQMGRMCSKKMVAALPIWLEFDPVLRHMSAVRNELLSMSSATIDRKLKEYRKIYGRRLRTGTKPSKHFKNVVPLKDFTRIETNPGHIEADTVAHCGTSMSGQFVWSLTLTDIATGWTVNRAIWGKKSDEVLTAIVHSEKELPFKIKSFNVDNGTEFLNRNVLAHFGEDPTKFKLTRSRAYRKNDNCHVEQKNFTHVRELFGYDRINVPEQIEYMNQIYIDYFNVLQNFFVPQMKLIDKMRVGSKYVRKYDKPKTPYQRVLESSGVSLHEKLKLMEKYKKLNPFKLQSQLKSLIKTFNQDLKKELKTA